MKYDRAFFDGGIQRRGTHCEKWDDAGVVGENCIPLWVADMDFPCADEITQALISRAAHASYGYNAENPEDAEALCGFWLRRHGLKIRPRQTQMLPCVVTGLKNCVRAFTGENDAVAIFTPCYGPFSMSVKSNRRKLVSVPLLKDDSGRYSMNLPGMEQALMDGAKLILLCNPHNPVSRAWNRDELLALVKLAKKYQVPLVSDEIHADFVFPPHAFTPVLSLEEARDCTVMLCAASKAFNVAGLQQAQAVCFREDLLARLTDACNEAGVTSGNTFALWGTRAAYTECDEWLDGLLAYLDENRKALPELMEKYLPKAKLTPIEATYLAWVDLSAYGKNCDELENIFKQNGVALTSGTFFGPEGEGYMRLNFGCPYALLEEGIKRMSLALKEE